MIPARSLTRTALPRAARSARASPRVHQVRLQSTTTSSSSSSGGSAQSPYLAGAVGGLAAGAALYGIYLVSPAGKVSRSINKTTKEAQKKYKEAAAKFQESTPDADQTVNYIKDLCYSYVGWIPGGRQYVDTAFKDYEKVRKNHKDEADAILKDAYNRFKEVSKGGLSLETARKGLDVLADVVKSVAELGKDAAGDLLDEHPQVKEKFGGSIDQLKQLGEQYGPEAKKQVDETWKQVADIIKGGFSAESISKAKNLIQEKTEQVKKMGDEAWKKGLEEAKPLLDKNPRIKELIEKNQDALKQGNVGELFSRARSAVESGETGDLEGYVNQAVEKAKSKGSQVAGGSGLEQFLGKIPNGSEILPKLQQLKEVAEKHTDESEKLVRETLQELKQVLESKSEKAKEIVDKAKKESSK
ncbi:hypothetical protein M406DRAFT_337183 [Cryphonectria parasitica EP155]|uniref:Uncharacterized protein n=1 Tax=Cryphonectria parasitica (strain ATCC 38755 / EP155) TaxID=660469 RepID=A0A9P4Y8S5_CRYP1|nr:uncharacterized protein M406DRAFT_337183 [Cryphonectria parasitica EP155]KAF3768841.1 hypothetical protein M406DRAFT_337183 [Cryphonectria parasitica EP155]